MTEMRIPIVTMMIRPDRSLYLDRVAYTEGPERVTDVGEVYEIARGLRLPEMAEERLYELLLDSKCQPLGLHELSHGDSNETFFPKREMLRAALIAGAIGIVLFHNHPSGDLEPSGEDIKMTREAVKSGKIVGVEVLDHCIISTKGYYSLIDTIAERRKA